LRKRKEAAVKKETLIILDEGMEPEEIAAMQVCCKTGPHALRTEPEE
jgi:hypothetical protein